MHFIHATTTEPASTLLADTLAKHLANNERVLWLLSGGSGGAICIAASQELARRGIPTDNLYSTMSDERYGAMGHADENIAQLLDGGFEVGDSTLYRPLISASRTETTLAFAEWLTAMKIKADYSIILMGIGADGHTAGIKPHSSAVTATQAAASFAGDDIERITVTPAFLKGIDEAIVQAMGAEKHATLRKLLTEDISLDEQPAQIIKHMKNATLLSDYTQ
jgi:6-phosphogluconolactonase/glucosamine-6-phosphate isomerase/deaminase